MAHSAKKGGREKIMRREKAARFWYNHKIEGTALIRWGINCKESLINALAF